MNYTNFTANVQQNKVTLVWSTATETNNQGFEILRSTQNDSEWKEIGFVPGRGTTTEISSYSFVDENLNPGRYNYRLKQIDFDGTYKYYDLDEVVEISSPIGFELAQNYPNPFNPTTTINFSIPQKGNVTLKIFDILGNEVRTLLNEEMEAGYHQVEFEANSHSGFVRNLTITKRNIFL